MTRRDALLLSASAGVGLTLPKQLHGLDSTKTAVHQQAGSCTTPQKVEQITVHGTSLEGNLEGDAVDRPVIRLPASELFD